MERDRDKESPKHSAEVVEAIGQFAEQIEAARTYAVEAVKPLSEEAKTLLLEAEKDKGGFLARRGSMTGSRIVTNGKEFGESNNPKDQARWEAALKELERGEFVESYRENTYRVTSEGFNRAETLREGD